MTWAIVWPRPLPASIETLLAHRWAFWAAAEALAEDGYRLLALDAVVCEIRGRLATARATKGASRKPGPLSAAALDVAVRWLRAHTEVTFLEHQLLPNPVKRPRNLGFLGLFATGALVEALRGAAEWAKGVWESAVMDEAWVRRRGAASPYRIAHGLTRFTAHRSIAVAREQAVAEWKSELPDRLLEDTCGAVAAYLKLKTGVELPVEELMHHARDNSPGGTAYRWARSCPPALDLPWQQPCTTSLGPLPASRTTTSSRRSPPTMGLPVGRRPRSRTRHLHGDAPHALCRMRPGDDGEPRRRYRAKRPALPPQPLRARSGRSRVFQPAGHKRCLGGRQPDRAPAVACEDRAQKP